MDDYIAKPIRARSALRDNASRAGSVGCIAGPARPEGDVDWSVALRAVQDNPALLVTIVETALEEMPRILKSIRQAVDNGEFGPVAAGSAFPSRDRCDVSEKRRPRAWPTRLEAIGQNGDLQAAAATVNGLPTPRPIKSSAAWRTTCGPIISFLNPLVGEAAQLAAGLHVELGLDDLAVGFDGLGADLQLAGDLHRAQCLADHLEDLQFAVGKGLRGILVQGLSTAARCSSSLAICGLRQTSPLRI